MKNKTTVVHRLKTAGLAALALALTLTLPVGSAQAQQQDDGSVVSVPGSEFNFGLMPQSSTVSHTFWIHSNSADTLTVDTVVSSCGCTSIPLDNPTLLPGDSLALTMEFRSHGFRGPIGKRPYFRLVGDTTSHFLKFYARIVEDPAELYPLASYPPILDFTVYSPQQTDTKPFALKNSAEEAIAISIVDFPADLIQISVPDSLQPGEIYEGLVSLKPGVLGTGFKKSITFEVNQSALYRLSLPLTSDGARLPGKPAGSDTTGSNTQDK